MEKLKHIAALDLGTSRIKAMVARKSETGALSIIASEQIESDNCIRRGCVFNVDETSEKVSRLIKRLNGKLNNSPIEKIYVGIGGQSLHTKPYSIKKEVPGGFVTQELIDSIIDESKDYIPETPGIEMFASVSPEFYLDGQLNHSPKGATASEIEAKFQLILGRLALKKTLITAVEFKAKIEIVDFFISPLATAKAVLSEKEKELGCALVEFGAGVTYVSVYKSGSLKYMAAIPLGGSVITKDITSLNILGEEAEELKLKYGTDAFGDSKDEINLVIEARITEIIANVKKQIEESGYTHTLGSGIVITGGASSLNDLQELIQEKTKQKVRFAEVKKALISHADEQILQPGNATIVGLLSLGTENCLTEIIVEEKKPETAPEPVSESGKVDMFGNPIGEKGRRGRNSGKNDGGGKGGIRGFLERASGSLFGDDKDNNNDE